jgi:hypothetical protein
MPHTGGRGASETTDSQMPWIEVSIAAMLVLGSALVIRRKSSEQ